MSRRDIIANIDQYKRRVDEHQAKIRNNPKSVTIGHWNTEIKTFESAIKKLEKDLHVAQSRMHCPNCKREVSLNGNKCSICRLVID